MSAQDAHSQLVAGRFQLTRRLARGGSGEVYEALDQSTGEKLALKRLHAPGGTRASAANFMREYYALSELRHPGIISVCDYGVDGQTPYYTMELLDGCDLRELSPLPFREACSHLRDVASALALLHARRMLHRDVSLRNVRRTSSGHCKLIDFGAMVPFGTPGNVMGTPPCVAPEALQGGALDQRSDLYSLGALAYHLLTGRHAYPAATLGELPALWSQGAPSLARLVPELPSTLCDLVTRLLRLDPTERPASAAEVIDWLSVSGGMPAQDDLAMGRSFLASSQLVGRNAECAQLQERLSKTAEGRGAALLIRGERGSGRTRMLSAAALIGQTCGLIVVRTALRKQRGVQSSLVRDVVAGLRHVAPVESERAREAWPLAYDVDRHDAATLDRGELLRQVEGYVCDVANARPLVLTVDDVQHADELASALIANLAHRTRGHSLALVLSQDDQSEASVLTTARLATSLALRALDRPQVALLSLSLFGDVPHLERISDWFYAIGRGNPKLTLELAQQLLARGTLRYADGSWILPAEIAEPLPADIVEALLLRLTPLGADARALAELLSVRRRGASAEQLLALCAPVSADTTFRALEELVSAGILESAGDEYSFVQDALRAQLARALAPARGRELHARWAEHLMSQPRLDQSTELEAGWHLVHTPNELRGAQLLARVAPRLIEQRVSLAAAVPALERALEVYELHEVDLAERLRLRALLLLSSYLFDFRLANRHATPLLDALYPFTGLRQMELCARWLGKRLGFVLGLAWAALRRSLQPQRQRGPRVIDALWYYARGTMGLLGLRALAVDVEAVGAVLQRMSGFERSPHRALSLVYCVAEAIHMHGRGLGAAVHRAIDYAQQELRRVRPWQMSDHEHRDLTTGLLLLQGINETGRERSRSLECAAQLERIATPLAIAASLRVRMTYYLLRGDLTQAQRYRRLLDLRAIENGSLWQVEWMALPLEWLASAIWADLIGLRQALERFDRFEHEAGGPAILREFLQQPYHFRRGEYAQAAELGELYIQTHAPRTRIGWEVVYGLSALAYVELGQPQRALAICEAALTHVGDEDREYFVMCVPLEVAHATALAYTGQAAQSQALLRARVARLRESGDLNYAILLHEYRIKVARRLNDQAALDEAFADLRDAALSSRNVSVIALANRLAQQSSPRAAPIPVEALHDLIACTQTDGGHAQQALAVIGQYADCQEAYLFVHADQSLQLAASLDELIPPEDMVHKLRTLPSANEAEVPALLDSGYCAYRLQCGFAVLRSATGAAANVPSALLREAERGLQSRAS